MNSRSELHDILCEIVSMSESNGDNHVYYNPPASFKMKYPAIRYTLKNIDKIKANNGIYRLRHCYELIVIDENPDSEITEKVLNLPYCEFDRSYKADNLNHNVFTLYYK